MLPEGSFSTQIWNVYRRLRSPNNGTFSHSQTVHWNGPELSTTTYQFPPAPRLRSAQSGAIRLFGGTELGMLWFEGLAATPLAVPASRVPLTDQIA